jgi:hypothetical protein
MLKSVEEDQPLPLIFLFRLWLTWGNFFIYRQFNRLPFAACGSQRLLSVFFEKLWSSF